MKVTSQEVIVVSKTALLSLETDYLLTSVDRNTGAERKHSLTYAFAFNSVGTSRATVARPAPSARAMSRQFPQTNPEQKEDQTTGTRINTNPRFHCT